MAWRVEEVERELEKVRESPTKKLELLALANERIKGGANLSRAEAAVFLNRSEKTLHRMAKSGKLACCPGYGSRVMFSARDVLRLRAAQTKVG
jgi:hypothetical protein